MIFEWAVFQRGKIMKLRLLGSLGLLVLGGGAQASGFALLEQNASGLGNAYAGQAASAQDASTIYYNPAGLTNIGGRQAVLSGAFIDVTAKFNGTLSPPAPLQSSLGGTGGNAGGLAALPSFYYAMDIKPGLKFGLGVNSPFGLKTDYDQSWMGRFQAVKSELKTVNINPALALKLNEQWSVGAGVDAQYVDATLTSMANYSALLGPSFSNLSGLSTVKGDDWSWGYNFGVLFEPSKTTRVGLNYRSCIDHDLTGTVSFADRPAPLNAAVPDGNVTAKLTLPDSASLSYFSQLNDRFDILADASWTHWSLFKDLTVVRDTGATLSSTQENWSDTWRYSLGLNYHVSNALTWRFGVAYDQTPVSEVDRTARIPDQSRTQLAVGVQYRPSRQGTWDVGYSHLFANDASISQNQTATGAGNLVGSYNLSVDILSLQYTHTF